MKYLLIFLMMVGSAFGTTYYVDANAADDTKDGLSPANAWKTIPYTWSAARDGETVAEGDTVLFATGDYGEFNEDSDDFASRHFYRDDWITYKADPATSSPENPPVFTNIEIENKDQNKTVIEDCSDLWTAGSGDTVTVDGISTHPTETCKIVLVAERTDGDKLAFHALAAPFVIDETTQTGFSFDLYNVTDPVVAGDYEVVLCSSSDGSKTGSFAAITSRSRSADEWFVTNKHIDLIGLTVNSVAIYANATLPSGRIVYLDNITGFGSGRSYLHFEGIEISDGVSLTDTDFVKLINCVLLRDFLDVVGFYSPYINFDTHTIICLEANNITIEDCDISAGRRGIYTSGNNYVMKRNNIHHIAGDGVVVGVPVNRPGIDNILFEGNTLYDLRVLSTKLTVIGSIDGTFSPDDVITQGTSGVTGQVVSVTSTTIFYFCTSEAVGNYGFVNDSSEAFNITNAGDGIMSAISSTDASHADLFQFDSGPGVTNLVITGNTFDRKRPGTDVGVGNKDGQGMKLHADVPNKIVGVIITNNVFIATACILMGGLEDAIINNNTFVVDKENVLPGEASYATRFYTKNEDLGTSTIAEFYNNILENIIIDPIGASTITFAVTDNNIYGYTVAVGNLPKGEFQPEDAQLANDPDFKALFTNDDYTAAGGADVTLATGSLAIDFGDTNFAPDTDILGVTRGSPPDAGAYDDGESGASGGIRGRYTDGYRTNYRSRYN